MYKNLFNQEVSRSEFLADISSRYKTFPDVMALLEIVRKADEATTGKSVKVDGFCYEPSSLDHLADVLDQLSNNLRPMGHTQRAKADIAAEKLGMKRAADIIRRTKLALE